VAVKFRDYYEVLGVPRTATTEEIRRAYRRLARQHHPDLQPPAQREAAEERFKEINEAHAVLADPEKRARYDQLGPDWKSGMDFTPPPGASRPGAGGFEGFGGDVSDFFEALFGRPGGGRAGGGPGFTSPGEDVEADLPVTLDEVLHGGRRQVTLDGRTLEVQIPAGVRDGTRIRLAGQGGAGLGGAPRGDLYLRVRLRPHPRYRVAGEDLEMDLPLWPWQALLGAEVSVETPDGPVRLRVPPGAQNGRRIRLRGRGLPRAGGERGDLFAVVRIMIPEQPTEEERAAYEDLRRRAAAAPDRPAGG
jgi:curved DNA-binding protein